MIGPVKSNAVLDTALTGINKGLDKLQENASQIASKTIMEGENTKPLVEALIVLKTNVQQVEASAKVLAAEDKLIGTLLDTKA